MTNQANINITVQIARMIVAGATPQEAVKAICGEDKFDAMVSDLYDALREKAGA